jgi:hypothetical protein
MLGMERQGLERQGEVTTKHTGAEMEKTTTDKKARTRINTKSPARLAEYVAKLVAEVDIDKFRQHLRIECPALFDVAK